MARYTGPVLKKCRALGIDPSEIGINKKSNRGLKANVRKKQSGYALQLKEKQKVKFIYGVLEKQFRMYYSMAEKMRGVTGENMLILLERRLDNIVFRMGIGASRAQSRQLVNHGHITVNGKAVNIPSYLIKAGDIIAIKESKREKPFFVELKNAKVANLPKWLTFDTATLTGEVKQLPVRDDIDMTIAEHMIVELYSK